jgi:hypothetical protein
MPTVDISDQLIPDGEDNDAGIELEVYVAKMADVVAWPEPNLTTAANIKDLVTVTADVTFATGKKFHRVGCTLEKGGVVSKGIGPYKAKSTESELTIYYPHSKEEYLGFIRKIQNSDLGFVIPERTGKKRMFGTKTSPAYLLDWEEKTGEKPGDDRGWMVKFKTSGKMNYYYEGEIQLVATP